MSVWWSDNHPRLKAEREAIAALSDNEVWLENVAWSFDDNFRMQVVFDIRLEHGVFPLQLIYHSTFPNTAPSVRPIDPASLSSHQYGTGDLCLEIRPDNWRPEFTGADMITSAFSLLDKEQPEPDGSVTAAPSAHNVPDNIAMRHSMNRLYLSETQLLALRNEAPKFAVATLWQQWCGVSHVVMHLAEISHNDWSWKDDTLPTALGHEAIPRVCIMVKSEKTDHAFKGVATKAQLVGALEIDPTLDASTFYCLVVPSEGLPTLFRQAEGAEGLIRYRSVLAPTDAEKRGGDLSDQLEGLRVAIVGLGSVGSKIASSLARAGVLRFDLVDDDILHAGNIDRHDGDWRDIGLHKVDLSKRRIGLISADAEVTARRVSIGAQVSSSEMAGVNGALAECDIIIDATANAEVLNHITAISLSAGNAVVWGGVYAGGIGGYIARSRPEKDPSPHIVRQALNNYYETVDLPPPVPQGAGYDAQASDETLIASDTDVTLLAGHMSSMALDTLQKMEPSDFDAPLYLIGFRRAWIFESAFDVRPIEIDAAARPQTISAAKDEAETNFVNGLVKKKIDEITNSTADA